jgi:hypothetical protein
MPKYQADSIIIASIWPGELEPKTIYVGLDPDPRSPRATVYRLEPAKRGSRPPYKLLEVFDSFENIPDYMNTDGGRPDFTSKPVLCEHIVENLLRFWAGNMVDIPAGAAPGIISLPKDQKIPHDKDLDRMFAMQTRFAEYQFQLGERMAIERDWKGITETMRVMAKWLGRERAWSSPELANRIEECPACKQPVPEGVFVCYHCGTKIKELTPELAALNAMAVGRPVPGVPKQV